MRDVAATEIETTRSFVLRNRAIVTAISIFVFLPSAVFALSFKPLPAGVIIAGCAGALALVASYRPNAADTVLQARVRTGRLLACIGLAAFIFVLGGETHIFFSTPDWLTRDAVLADLVHRGFAVAYRVKDTDYVLRAPLGMYILPAVVGRIFGLVAAHIALLTQNAVFLGAIFYLLMTLGRGWRHLAILIGFAGLSLVGGAIILIATQIHTVGSLLLWGLDSWHPAFQYSSSMVQFFWVPNHALPGWWLATLLILQRRGSIDVAVVGVSVAGLSFWSPLAVLPAVPWLIYVAATSWRPVLLSGRTWLGVAAASCLLPLIAFLVLAASTIHHETMLAVPGFTLWYLLFIVLQLPALRYLGAHWIDVGQDLRPLVVVNGIVLLVLPFVAFGPNNDLVMRGSIASLTIIAFAFGAVVTDLWDRSRASAWVGCALILVTSASAIVEVRRALVLPRYAISSCSLMEVAADLGGGFPSNYAVRSAAVPTWLMDTAARQPMTAVPQQCWPDRVGPP